MLALYLLASAPTRGAPVDMRQAWRAITQIAQGNTHVWRDTDLLKLRRIFNLPAYTGVTCGKHSFVRQQSYTVEIGFSCEARPRSRGIGPDAVSVALLSNAHPDQFCLHLRELFKEGKPDTFWNGYRRVPDMYPNMTNIKSRNFLDLYAQSYEIHGPMLGNYCVRAISFGFRLTRSRNSDLRPDLS